MSLLINKTNQFSTPINVAICRSFFMRFKGLMFRKEILPNEAIAIVEPIEGIASTSIHMFFMKFDIAAIWIDSNHIVVHKTIAKKWKPYYASPVQAKIILETHTSRISEFNIGDQIVLEND